MGKGRHGSQSNLLIGSALNIILAITQLILGVLTNTLALTSDSIDSVSDAITCIMPILFDIKDTGCCNSDKKPKNKGDKSDSNMDNQELTRYYLDIGLMYGMVLARLVIISESIQGLLSDDSTNYGVLTIIAGSIGIAVNILIAIILRKESKALLFCLLNDLIGSILTLILSIISYSYTWNYNISDKSITLVLSSFFIMINVKFMFKSWMGIKGFKNVICIKDLKECLSHSNVKNVSIKYCELDDIKTSPIEIKPFQDQCCSHENQCSNSIRLDNNC